MMDDLEERLRDHSRAFDSLLSLIPAKEYYEQDRSDQWQKKKQTKSEARAAKRAKLDPSNIDKSVKEVMDERSKKRKRDDDDEIVELPDGVHKEQPHEGMKHQPLTKAERKEAKRQRRIDDQMQKKTANLEDAEDQEVPETNPKKLAKLEKKKLKAMRRKENAKKKAEKIKSKAKSEAEEKKDKEEKDEVKDTADDHEDVGQDSSSDSDEESETEDKIVLPEVELDMDKVEGLSSLEDESDDANTSSLSASTDSPKHETKDMSSEQSQATSQNGDDKEISSSVSQPESHFESSNNASTTDQKSTKQKISPEELRARLQKRISELRAARKADGVDGKTAKSRAELLEARRKKEEQRRQHKKEMRFKAKLEEQRKLEEMLSGSFSSSTNSLLGSPAMSPPHQRGSNDQNKNRNDSFIFGKVEFADGQQLDGTATALVDAKKKKGPQDPATALKVAQAKQARLAGFDDTKRADIAEKDMWLNAKRRAFGEKVRDDASLLKKALKRKEKMKEKSSKEWQDRLNGVEKAKRDKQKKREDNLRKRREEKGKHGKKGKGRAGFEGKRKV